MRHSHIIALILPLIAALLAIPAQAFENSAVCGIETAKQERLQQIPDQLLHAISLVESGRWDSNRRESFAWPWTVMAQGEGRFFQTKEEAVAWVRNLQAQGVRNIDVGCMQVNLQAHKNAFASLDEAFDPASNVAYAARFLVGLYSSTGNWATAGAYYHSQTPSLAAEYKSKLLAAWNGAKGRGDTRLALALNENYPPLGMGLGRPLPPPATRSAANSARPTLLSERAAAAREKTAAERLEAKRIADAYRQARLAEYQLRRQQILAMAKG